jgi:hypothetical protein
MRKHHPKSDLIERSHLADIKEPTAHLLDKADATALTLRIRTAVEGVRDMLLEAHDRQAWKALGYNSWSAYVRGEFDMGRAHSYRLLDQGRVIKAIGHATGKVSHMGDISERTARELKSDLPGAIEEIKVRSEQGEDPAQSAKEIAAERKAAKEKDKVEKDAEKTEKETPQAEYDHEHDENRAKLPAIKQQQVAKEAAIEVRKAKPDDGLTDAGRIAELEEAVRALEEENASLKAENALYGDMKGQWTAGGFDAVIAGKDEEIRVLETRLDQESRSTKHWKAEAIRLGWSNEEVTDG